MKRLRTNKLPNCQIYGFGDSPYVIASQVTKAIKKNNQESDGYNEQISEQYQKQIGVELFDLKKVLSISSRYVQVQYPCHCLQF